VDIEIIGVQKVQGQEITIKAKVAHIHPVCFKCNKRVDNSQQHSIIECSSCHFKQKQNLAPKHWFAQLLVKVKNSASTTKLTLTLFEITIQPLAKISGHAVEIN